MIVSSQGSNPDPPSAQHGPWKERSRPLLIALAVGLLAVLCHLPALRNGFVFDDHYEIELNPVLRAPFSLLELLHTEYWGSGSKTGWYRPVPLIIQKALFDRFGTNPLPYHLVVLLIHAMTAAGLAWFLAARSALPRAGLVLGALFAVHTVHAEAVGTAYGLKEVLAASFSFWALVVLTAPTSEKSAGRLLRLFAAAALVALAVLSKESSAPIPAALIAADLFRGAPFGRLRDALRTNGRRALFDGAFLTAAVFGAISMRYPVVGQILARSHVDALNNPILDLPFPASTLMAFRVVFVYLRALVWPLPFSPSYSKGTLEVPASVLAPDVLLGIAVFAALVGAVIVAHRLRTPAGAGAVWTFATYLLASNLVLHFSTLMSERFIYLPSIGLALLFAPAVDRFVAKALSSSTAPRRYASYALLCLPIAALGALTWSRTPVYGSDSALMESAYRWYPGNAINRLARAGTLIRDDRLEEAEAEIVSILKDVPDLPRAYEDLALISTLRNDRAGAHRHWRKATEHWAADVGTHLAYAEMLLQENRTEEAIRQLSEGIRKGPGTYKSLSRARELRGTLLMRTTRTHQGMNDLRLACIIDPESAAAWDDLATALQQMGDLQGAETALRRSISAAPSRPDGLRRLSRLLLSQRRGSEAIVLLERILAADPNNPGAMSDLGTSYMQAGRIVEARRTFEGLLVIDPGHLVALATLGSIVESQGEPAAAAGYYERYLRSAPEENTLTASVRARLARLGHQTP